MTEKAFNTLVNNIRNTLGCGKGLAIAYAQEIGDTPEVKNNEVLIRNADKRIIARLPASVLQQG